MIATQQKNRSKYSSYTILIATPKSNNERYDSKRPEYDQQYIDLNREEYQSRMGDQEDDDPNKFENELNIA